MLWFLIALIMCYLVYLVFPYITRHQKYLIAFAAIAYLWALSISPAYGNILLDKEPSMMLRNCIGLGLPFFTLGYFIHKHWRHVRNAAGNQSVKLAILAFVLYFIEQIIYLSHGHYRSTMEASIFMPLVVLSILILTTAHPCLLSKTPFPKWSAKYSLYIYVGHTAVINILSKVLFDSVAPKNIRYYKVLLLYLAIIVITLIASWLYVLAKKLTIQLLSRKYTLALVATSKGEH